MGVIYTVMRYHLPHPTQHAACGSPASVLVVSFEALQTKPAALRCKRCLKVQAALDAGRPVYSGLEPAALEGVDPAEVEPFFVGDAMLAFLRAARERG